jgi:uncharacterized RDD family membrane protein YckC
MPPGYTPYATAQAAPNYASFGARFGALFIDGLIQVLFTLPAIIAFFTVPTEIKACTVNDEPALCEVPTGSGWAIIVGLGVVGTIAFWVIYCKKVAAGQSWGQKATGVRIVDVRTGGSISAGRVFGRQICRIFSGFLCYLGYFWMLWDKQKQTWHDKMVSTIVVKA